VSLRDVDRVLTVMSWFYEQSQSNRILFDTMDEKLHKQPRQELNIADSDSNEEEEDEDEGFEVQVLYVFILT